MMGEVKSGRDTSEFAVAEKAGFWGSVAMVAGMVVTLGAPMLNSLTEVFGADAKVVVYGGIIMTVAGIILKALTSLGYSKARADVKVADAQKNADG